MAAPNPYSGTAEDFTDADWKEACKAWAPGTGTFTKQAAQHTLVGYVDEAKELAAIRYMLGYSAVSEDTTRSLLRTPPVAHPKYPNLYCTGVGTAGLQPDARTGTGIPNRGLKRPKKNTDPDGGRVLGHFTGYRKTQLTLHFEPLAYPVEPDSTSLGSGTSLSNGNFEWRRWTTWDCDPRVETLSLGGRSLIFAEGGSNTAPTSNPLNPAKPNAFPADQGKLIVKSDLVIRWHDVPIDWVMTPNYIPWKILLGLGKVNRYSFGDLGGVSGPEGSLLFYPPGTLLLSAAKIKRYPNPLYHPGTQATQTVGRESKQLLDIEFYMTFFDPPKGRTSNATITTDRGHNNCPWRGAEVPATGALVTGDLNAGKWFLATYSGAKGTDDNPEARLYERFNYAMLFDGWRNALVA